jgi:transcriptional regulator with XRE-family HTH domain
METIALIIESTKDGEFWGRVQYDDNLIVETALSVPELERKMKVLLKDWHALNPKEITFNIEYDIAGLFEEKKFLNAAVIAERAGINKSLMRQYASGIKFPSFERAKQIEQVIHEMGKEMIGVKISVKGKASSAIKQTS